MSGDAHCRREVLNACLAPACELCRLCPCIVRFRAVVFSPLNEIFPTCSSVVLQQGFETYLFGFPCPCNFSGKSWQLRPLTLNRLGVSSLGLRLQGSEFRVWGFRSDISGCEVCRITALTGTGLELRGLKAQEVQGFEFVGADVLAGFASWVAWLGFRL